MRGCLESGSLELLWLCARNEPVAVLYAIDWGGKVYAYQTGRRTDVPGHLRPGAVLLALAIRRAIEAGRREFDLLADEALYKRQLASQSRPLVRCAPHALRWWKGSVGPSRVVSRASACCASANQAVTGEGQRESIWANICFALSGLSPFFPHKPRALPSLFYTSQPFRNLPPGPKLSQPQAKSCIRCRPTTAGGQGVVRRVQPGAAIVAKWPQ